jgi:hypothetical protein
MTGFLLTLFVIAMTYCIATTIAALRRVKAGGVDQTEEFLRSGVTLEGLVQGNVPEQESGSLITIREGVRLSSDNGKLKFIPTSTISRDLY